MKVRKIRKRDIAYPTCHNVTQDNVKVWCFLPCQRCTCGLAFLTLFNTTTTSIIEITIEMETKTKKKQRKHIGYSTFF